MVSHANCALSHMHTDARVHTLDRANSDQNRYFVLRGVFTLSWRELKYTHKHTPTMEDIKARSTVIIKGHRDSRHRAHRKPAAAGD